MRVYAAPEINIVRALRESGLKSVLYDVLPSVMFDYVSYSAYESINALDPSAALHADLDTIAAVIGSNSIIVGETGFSRTAWGADVHVAGGARAIQQYLAAGLLDALYLHIAPILLGGGARLLENVGDPKLEPVKVVASPAATHIKYRVSY